MPLSIPGHYRSKNSIEVLGTDTPVLTRIDGSACYCPVSPAIRQRATEKEIRLPSGDLPVFTFDDEYLWEIHLSSILHQVVRVYLDSEGVITFPHRANGESGLLDDVLKRPLKRP